MPVDPRILVARLRCLVPLFLLANAVASPAATKVVRLVLDGPVLEAPSDSAGLMALLEQKRTTTLYELTRKIDEAARDKNVSGIALIIEAPELSFAQLEELARTFRAFREQGKKVFTYLDQGNNLSYALAAACSDHITLAEYSDLWVIGLYADLMYFKGLLDKVGVKADMLHCGAYKSALEPFTRTEPSPEAAENVNWLLDSIYDRWIQTIADGRNLSPEQVRKLVDQAPLSAKAALEGKLVDDVSSFATYKKLVRKAYGEEADVVRDYEEAAGPELNSQNPFAIFQVFSSLLEKASATTEPGVGLIFVNGAIMTGKSDPGAFGGDTTAGSTTIRGALDKALRDDSIRAVVLRVDSPGGSALASDIIWKAATRLAAEKPLVVSMGAVAGSGGYYVSLPGDVVFAEKTTITGSIGVVGGKLVWRELMEDKLGITTTAFSRGKHSGLNDPDRLWSADERSLMERYLNDVYVQFKDRVKASRGARLKKDLEEIAGGRVYTGEQALALGLVDKVGGLNDALKYAANKAGLGPDFEVHMIPRPSGFAEFVKLMESLMGQDEEDDFMISTGNGLLGRAPFEMLLPLARDLAPSHFRELVRCLRNLSIVQRERVGCFMPSVPCIR